MVFHSCIDGHLGDSHLLAIAISAGMIMMWADSFLSFVLSTRWELVFRLLGCDGFYVTFVDAIAAYWSSLSLCICSSKDRD